MTETTKFTEDILSVSRDKARQVVEQAENERQRRLEEAKVVILREANNMLRIAEAEAQGIKHREVSELRHKMKLLEQSEKGKILTAVLNEVKEMVHQTRSNENTYVEYLGRLAADAISQLGMAKVTVGLNADDLKRIDASRLTREIEKHGQDLPKLEISKEPISASGGVVLSSPDGRIRIMNTFEERFEALEPRLLIEAGRLLFGQK